jgi:hypothetical protein
VIYQARKEFQKHDLENVCWVWYVTENIIYRTTIKSGSAKIIKEQDMRNKVKCSATIKANGISLTPKAEYTGIKIKKSYQIGDGRFRFSGTILAKFDLNL